MIHFPSIGVKITPQTPPEEVAKLRAKYPEVDKAVAKREAKNKAATVAKAEKKAS